MLGVCLSAGSIHLPARAVTNTQAAEKVQIAVTVTGCVGRPGVVILYESRNLLTAVSRAGGFTRMAEKRAVVVTSKNGEEKTYDIAEVTKKDGSNPPVKDGDVIFVPER